MTYTSDPSSRGVQLPHPIMPPSIQPSGRFSVQRRPDDLWIFIGPRRAWGFAAFLCIWLCGWALGEFLVLGALAVKVTETVRTVRHEEAPFFFLAVWLTLWTLGGFLAIRTLLGELAQWQEIYISRYLLVKRTRLFHRVRETVVDLSTVEEFRVTTPQHHLEDWSEDTLRINEWAKQGIAARYGGGVAPRHLRRRASLLDEMDAPVLCP